MRRIVEMEIGPIQSRVSDREAADELLQCRKVIYRRLLFGKQERKEYQKHLVSSNGQFLSGFAPRLRQALERKGFECRIVSEPAPMCQPVEPQLPDLALRDDQKVALGEIIKAGRGVWKAPTGSGKTVLMGGLISAYPTSTFTILVHTGALFTQTIAEMERWFPGQVGWYGAGKVQRGRITVCMRQTLVRVLMKDSRAHVSDVVIVDEAHHVSSLDGDYGKILTRLNSRMRIGFTATPPRPTTSQWGNEDQEAVLAPEGLLGPVIGETSYTELQEKDVLAKPRLKLYRVPDSPKIKWLKGDYKDVYTEGIVKYRRRNALITKVVTEQVEDHRKTVLVLVERIEHGEELLSLFDILLPGVFTFLHGNTDEALREKEKMAFESRERRGVIATRVWAEGVNIKSVEVVVNAVGGESEIAAIQRFGRGMRKAEGKDEVLLIDFIDLQHRYFQRHSLIRVCTYSDWGWL